MLTRQALELAYQDGLDLVEIVPTAIPPIAEIMDFSKYKFDEKKKKKDQQAKAKTVTNKEIRLRPVSEDHDVDMKIKQLKRFLEDKHPVTVNIIFKAREIMFKDQGWAIVKKVIAAVEDIAQQANPPRLSGHKLSVRLIPK